MAARTAQKLLRWRNTPATAVVVLVLTLCFVGVYFGIDAGSSSDTLMTVFAGLILIGIGVDLLRLALRFLPMRLVQRNKKLIFTIGIVLIVGSTVYAGKDLIHISGTNSGYKFLSQTSHEKSGHVEQHCDPVKIPPEVLHLFAKGLFDDPTYLRECQPLHYEQAGKITSGHYAGWNRVAVSISADMFGPGYDPVFFLATKDGSHFVLDQSNFDNLPKEYVAQFDQDFVTATVTLPNIFSPEIDMGSYNLVQEDAEWGPVPADAVELPSKISGAKFYARPPKQQDLPDVPRSVQKEFNSLQTEYAQVTTEVLIEDNSGFRYWYHLVPKDLKDSSGFSDYRINNGTDFTAPNSYEEYLELWKPYGCGGYGVSTILQNISSDDLVPFAKTASGIQLYTFKDGRGRTYRKLLMMRRFSECRRSSRSMRRRMDRCRLTMSTSLSTPSSSGKIRGGGGMHSEKLSFILQMDAVSP
jgi:hypothetical protein